MGKIPEGSRSRLISAGREVLDNMKMQLNRDEEDDTGFLNVNNTKKSGTKKSKNSKETVAVDQVRQPQLNDRVQS